MTQTTDQLLKRFFAEDTIALAKIISLIENRAPGYQEILDALYPKTGGAYRDRDHRAAGGGQKLSRR
jgi:putative protein kinase ArgK-like GTPase of G3E family